VLCARQNHEIVAMKHVQTNPTMLDV